MKRSRRVVLPTANNLVLFSSLVWLVERMVGSKELAHTFLRHKNLIGHEVVYITTTKRRQDADADEPVESTVPARVSDAIRAKLQIKTFADVMTMR